MNIQKITNITVVILAVVALIVLGVIIGQGDEYIEMSAMQGNYGFVSIMINLALFVLLVTCLLYTSPSPRDTEVSRMPSSA